MELERAVTIVIPTHNRPDFLREAIRSALAQTLECEVIVVEHGGDFPANNVASEFGERVKYLGLPDDYGPHFSWLHGVLAAKGRYIKILFDDDLIDPHFVEQALKLMDKNVGFVFCASRLIGPDGQSLGSKNLYSGLFRHTGIKEGWLSRRKIQRIVISPGAMLARREDVIDALYQGRLPFQKRSYFGVGPDHNIKLLGLLRYPAFAYVASPAASFRAHDASITISSQHSIVNSRAFRQAYLEPYFQFRLLRFHRPFLATLRVMDFLAEACKALLRVLTRRQ